LPYSVPAKKADSIGNISETHLDRKNKKRTEKARKNEAKEGELQIKKKHRGIRLPYSAAVCESKSTPCETWGVRGDTCTRLFSLKNLGFSLLITIIKSQYSLVYPVVCGQADTHLSPPLC
jgi:hypothetical protein